MDKSLREPALDWFQRARPPAIARPQASAFADWIFQQSTEVQYLIAKVDGYRSRKLKLGQMTRRDIELFSSLQMDSGFLGKTSESDWIMVFCDNTPGSTKTFGASALQARGLPMRCVPDVVLKSKHDDVYLIIERKTTFVPEPHIPVDGWPNVEAQLWCYSWIDQWKDAKEVLLVGQL